MTETDPSGAKSRLALEPAALNEAQHLARRLREEDNDTEARSVLGWF